MGNLFSACEMFFAAIDVTFDVDQWLWGPWAPHKDLGLAQPHLWCPMLGGSFTSSSLMGTCTCWIQQQRRSFPAPPAQPSGPTLWGKWCVGPGLLRL